MHHERVISRKLDAVWVDLAQSAVLPERVPSWEERVEPTTDGFRHERYVSKTTARRYERELYSGVSGVLAVREVVAATGTGSSTVVRMSVSTFDASLTDELADVFLMALEAVESRSDT